MKLGISSYTFTWAIGVPGQVPPDPVNELDLLDKTNKLGLSLLQIADNLPLDQMDPMRQEKLRSQAENMGIQIEVGARGMTEANLGEYIHLAKKYGSPILRFVIDGKDYEPDLPAVISIVKNAIPDLTSNNVILAIENHDRLLAGEFLEIIDGVGSDYVGICLDCANSLGAGEGFYEVIRILAPHVVNLHLKDISIKRKYHMMGFDVEGTPFGAGNIPLEWTLDQLTSRCKTAILELWTPPEERLHMTILKEDKWARQSIDYLKNFFD